MVDRHGEEREPDAGDDAEQRLVGQEEEQREERRGVDASKSCEANGSSV